jgi:hypothetical protein
MKSVTEFWGVALAPALAIKTALTTEGKSAEEIATALGEKLKMEGDKLKHAIASIEVLIANPEKLSRVKVVSLAEGETPPAKAIKVEEFYYVPEFATAPKPVQNKKMMEAGKGGGRGGPGGGKGGKDGRPKTSPWGLTPEEKAAKGKGGGKAKTPAT